MKIVEEINSIVKNAGVQKEAGWLTDWFTRRFINQSDEYRRSQGWKPFSEMDPVAEYYASKKKNDQLTNLAQSASDKYRKGSIAKTKYYHNGVAVSK